MKVGHVRRPVSRHDGERGAALIIALVVMLVMGVLVSSVAMYATTAAGGVGSYRVQRDERYAGDGAIKTAITWAATQPTVGRDPDLGLASAPCVMNTTAVIDGEDTPVKVSCTADEGGNSGKPADVGLVPPEAMVLTGNRTKEPGPFNARQCQGWWDTVTGWFSNNYNATEDVGRGLISERGAWFAPRRGTGTLGASCTAAFSRGWADFKVRGSIATASNVRVDNGSLNLIADVPGNDKLYAADPTGCVITGTACVAMENRPSTYAGALAYLNGTSRASDPGRKNPSAPNRTPVGDIAAPFQAAGFNDDGTPKEALTERTTAYTWNSTTNVFTPISTCTGTSPTVVFLPGWYRSAEVINKYTGGSGVACKNATFWFAPNSGTDGVLLTEDDETGTYLFDFANQPSTATSCGATTVNSSTRWCIGYAADSNSRVVVGTPDGWTPQGTYTPGSGTEPPQTALVIDQAGTVDKDLSQSWFKTSSGAGTSVDTDARSIDGKVARYTPSGCFFICPSIDRAIRVRDFSPKITAPPIEKSGAPRGRIYVEVAYGVQNPSSANAAEAVIEAVSPASGRKQCGTYTLFGNSSAAAPYNNRVNANYAGTGTVPSYKFTDAQAKQLADLCGTVDLINGLEVKVQVRGNGFNIPTVQWWLDGVRMSYDATRGANFPYPTNPVGSESEDVKAKSDCDPSKAGGQLVFNGDSHVVVNDGTLEVCAGPFRPTATADDAPDDHQQIGIWAMPSVAEVVPKGSGLTWGGNTSSPTNQANAYTIDKQTMNFNIGACNFACGDRDAWAKIPMNGYTPPAGYRIQKIVARVGYHSISQGCSGLFKDCSGKAPTLDTPACSEDFPKVSESLPDVEITNKDVAVLYDASMTNRNCLGVTANGASLPEHDVTWHAKVNCIAGICGGPWNDRFDGIAYEVTLKPTDTASPRLVPQSGCIVAHPNYNEGAGGPDCALVRAVQSTGSDNYTAPWNNPTAHSVGRFSVQGTIYAPASAIEVDDTDVAYPLATRGLIARHLRVSGFEPRTNYDGIAIDTFVDRTPQPREALFTACVQKVSASTEPCAPGDQILTRARVRYNLDAAEPDPTKRAKVPVIEWWSNDR
jgi:hypothetical protein